jgi:transposase
VAQALTFTPGTIVADDRSYNDYAMFGRWCEQGVFFVTRMKIDARFEVEQQEPIFVPQGNVVGDQRIRLSSDHARRYCPQLLRRVLAVHPETGQTLVFLTNLHHLSVSTIAAIYKDRWQVELFFKALKQNLKIKTFVGTSANAVKTQIWTALICMLLLRYLLLKSRFG